MFRATRRLLRFQDVLQKCTANYAPLSPIQWIERAAWTYPNQEAVHYRPQDDPSKSVISRDWATTHERSVKLASALDRLGCGRGEVVQVMLGNTPEMLESHFGVPMSGAVLGSINSRLDSASVAYVLEHSESKALIFDQAFGEVVSGAVAMLPESARKPILIQVDRNNGQASPAETSDTYESFISSGDASYGWHMPKDEFDAIALNYTSGTTGKPKGCVLHHRGAYLTALGNTLAFGGMNNQTRYLWTLPMFHCNGWNFPYTIAALGGANLCLDKVCVESIRSAIVQDGATHLCGAPMVLTMAIEACKSMDGNEINHTNDNDIKMMVAAAPPPSAVLREAQRVGISVTHVYGLTEVYGPATVCEWIPEWNRLEPEEQAAIRSRQGVRYATMEELTVLDRETGLPTPADSETIGEVAMRGNMVFKGYHKNEEETKKALKDGYFWTGDLGVMSEDGYIALKDRAKDIIISGGENISSIEVEDVLHQHPKIQGAALVAMPHEKWQEVGCAFVETVEPVDNEDEFELDVIQFCKERLPRFKAPHKVVVGPLPKTNLGKIQKFELRNQAKEFGVTAPVSLEKALSRSADAA